MLGTLLLLAPLVGATAIEPRDVQCPGYKASNVKESPNSLTADLQLAGTPCNTFGDDLQSLKLLVEYQTDKRLHVMIHDADEEVYQVPEYVLPRPENGGGTSKGSALKFDYKENPFSFTVSRDGEVLFDTSASELVFQSQYLKLRTWLPDNPNLYGLGEHTDPLRFQTTNYTRTLWSRDAYSIPSNTNLYGNHPVYYDHRGQSGTHGVFLLNSNGMDVKVAKTDDGKQYLEYNVIGGVFDFYFLHGPSPKEVSAQYAQVVGLPVMMSYWTLGFHQCRYGYRDVYNVAEVVYNYSQANIPLETMWTDIDYMDARKTFTLDPKRFPLDKMRELVNYLHEHEQQYIVMVDPAVSVSDNEAFNNAQEQGTLMHRSNGTLYEGVVWPGVTAFPDWFNPNTQDWWNSEFANFFSADNGVNIDGLWIDMNEPANFCVYPCSNPEEFAKENNDPPAPPPVRENPRPLPGFPADFQPPNGNSKRDSRKGKKLGLPGREYIDPPYKINNAAGSLSMNSMDTDLVHAGEGYVEYDTHNLYGTMMSTTSRGAMENRRPAVRPLVITRSTFAGAGASVGHWLGDNLSEWGKYRISIAEQLEFASMFQIPMVGSDVCGFGGNTTEELCARWASLGAFSPFYRNHNELGNIDQEFYRWPTVADSARKAIDIRYRLLDYIYTSFHRQTETGEPFLQPLFYLYPEDKNTFANDLQFFYGDALMVSPVTDEGSTSVDAYFPDDIFYDWYTGKPVRGHGHDITLTHVDITHIPLHIRGGNILPVRSSGANTTAELRKKPFEVIIAPSLDGTAEGSLYYDDGDSQEQPRTTEINFKYGDGVLQMDGQFGYDPGVKLVKATLLQGEQTRGATKKLNVDLTGPAKVRMY